MLRSICVLLLLHCLCVGAQAQRVAKAAELANLLDVETRIDALANRHEQLTRERISLVVLEFKNAGLSSEAQAELERLASHVTERIAASWSKAQAKEMFVGSLASRLSQPDLEHAILFYGDSRHGQAVSAICTANDAMRIYVETSAEAASRKALPEFLQSARTLR